MDHSLPGAPGTKAPARDCFLVLCRALNVLSSLCLLLCATAFGMAIGLRDQAPVKDLYFLSGQAVRAFGLAGAFVLVLVETEWRVVLKAAPVLEAWVGRGMCQLFLAALTYREAYASRGETDFAKSLQLYRSLASGSLLVSGAVYVMGGALCMGAVRRARLRREEQLCAAEAEFAELEGRRRELQRLLGRPNEP